MATLWTAYGMTIDTMIAHIHILSSGIDVCSLLQKLPTLLNVAILCCNVQCVQTLQHTSPLITHKYVFTMKHGLL